MNRHHRSSVFGACLITAAMLFASPVCAKPDDYNLQVVEAANDKVKVHVTHKSDKKDVTGVVIRANGTLGPRGDPNSPRGIPTMIVPMRAVPTSIPGEYAFKVEPGMEVFALDLVADVPGETEKVKKKVDVNENENDQQGQNGNGQ